MPTLLGLVWCNTLNANKKNIAGRGLEQINADCLKLKRQLKVRDKQIEELTEEANQLQFRNGELSEKLATIRVDMGLPAQEADEEGVQRRAGERPKALMQVTNWWRRVIGSYRKTWVSVIIFTLIFTF